MSLRKRLSNSRRLNRAVIRLFAGYLRLAYRTTRFERDGFEDLTALLKADKPVIMVLWHSRIAFSPFMFDHESGEICSLTSTARAGRLAGQIQAEFGFQTVAMKSRKSNIAVSREVMRKIRDGVSIGIAADGPQGPRHQMKTVPLEWARLTGAPIILVTFSVRRFWRWKSWDRMIFPFPFNKGVLLFRRWDVPIPRRPQADELEALRLKLEADLDALIAEADMRIGHPSPQ